MSIHNFKVKSSMELIVQYSAKHRKQTQPITINTFPNQRIQTLKTRKTKISLENKKSHCTLTNQIRKSNGE